VDFKPATYRAYKAVWKRLLAFMCRTALSGQLCAFRYRFTDRQVIWLDRLIIAVRRLPTQAATTASTIYIYIDCACFILTIALLDYDLRGNLYKNIIMSFFAALAIDVKKKTLINVYNYILYFSEFVKLT
jgi:hypothetical protein